MNDFINQSLACIIDISNGTTPQKITAEATEAAVAESLIHALSLVHVKSAEFEEYAAAISFEKYCSLKAFRLVYDLYEEFIVNSDAEKVKLILKELTCIDVPSLIFRKYIYFYCVHCILNLRLLSEYKEFVSTALVLLKDESVQYPAFFEQ